MPAASRRLRVLLLIDHAGVSGGAERFVTGLAIHLPRDRVEVCVCSTRDGRPLAVKALTDAGIRHINLGRRRTWDAHRFWRLITLLRREHFDVLHSHMFGSNLWGSTIGRLCRVPVTLAHEHNWSYSGDTLRLWLDGHVIGRLTTRLVAVSEANRERMIDLEGIPSEKIEVMPTGYIPSLGPASDIRHELGIGRDVPLIGNASILRPEKALDVLIDAHALLRGRVDGAHLVIAGAGPCRQSLERQTELLGTTDSVHFLGMRQDVDAVLRSVDVGAMSSDWEGMPLFVFECMAAGAPFVATSVGGLPEIVRHRHTGMLVAPQDPPALARALAELLTDRTMARGLASAAARRLPEFSIETVAGRFADLYARLRLEAAQR